MVSLSVCRPSDVDELIHLLSEVFTERDPPAMAVGLTVPEFESLVDLYRDRAGQEGLTIVARSTATGEMIGALLGEDSAAPFPHGVERLSPKFDPIFDILGQLDAEYRASRTIVPGEALHMFLLGVKRTFAGQKVAQEMVRMCLENGRGCGYRLAITEATNNISRHIFRKAGFEDRVHRPYCDHRFCGQAVFASITEHEGPTLLDRPLVTAATAPAFPALG
jgi:ribosomal protein S18 acetylase RimI-like enzyme